MYTRSPGLKEDAHKYNDREEEKNGKKKLSKNISWKYSVFVFNPPAHYVKLFARATVKIQLLI